MKIEAHRLSKLYANGRGVTEVSFSFQSGGVIALAGGNGAGKSTLLRLITGQEQATSGSLTWSGARSVNFMPDDVNFPPALSAEEIVRLLGSLKGSSRSAEEAVLQRVGLWEARKQTVSHYSKGMRQRLNLAQALLGSADFLVLDEPTNGLDPYWVAELKHIVTEQAQCGKTVLFSTHLLSFAEELAEGVLLLHEGRVLASGALGSVLAENGCQHIEELFLRQLRQR